MNRAVLTGLSYGLRYFGLFGSFWFFFWAWIVEMVIWRKPGPDLFNVLLFFVSLSGASLPSVVNRGVTKSLPAKVGALSCPECKEKMKMTEIRPITLNCVNKKCKVSIYAEKN